MNTPTAYFAKEFFCDQCFRYSDNQVQTVEGDWLCPVCAEKNTCYECGRVSLELSIVRVDGKAVRLCEDCEHAHKMDNPFTTQDIIDIQKYAAKLLGY